MKTQFTFRGWLAAVAFFAYSFFVSGSNNNLFAQSAGSYGFTQTAGTYTPITGGTVLNASIPDSWVSAAVTLTPGFSFCGVTYTTAFVSSNGFITLGGSAPTSATYNTISTTTGSGIALAVFNADLRNSTMSGVASNIRYELVGNEHVFQWQDASRWATETTERYSFQARLNHVTGVVTYVYTSSAVGTSTSYQPIIGIRTANTVGNWQNRLVETGAETWATSLQGTATTSAVRFTNTAPAKIPTNGQNYIFTPPVPCNTATGLPTAGTVTATPGSLCMSGNVTLNFSPNTPFPAVTGISYKWQTSPTLAGTYVDIPGAITTVPTYTTTVPITASAYFKCVVLCNTTSTVLTSAASNQVVVNNPGTPTVTAASRCGPGTVSLGAAPPSGSTINWYAAATGGAPIGTGATYNTPYLPTTTTFYAAASSGSSVANLWVGTGTSTTPDYRMPYYDYYYGNKVQYLIRASELLAIGLGAGNINSIGFDVTTIATPFTFTGFEIKMKPTNLTVLTAGIGSFETGLLTYFSAPTYTPVANSVNTHTLSTPFIWDGVSNIIIEVCHNNSSYNTATIGGAVNVKYSTYTYNTTHYAYADAANQCTTLDPFSGDGATTVRPNIRFNMNLGCSGARVPVVATVNPSPVVAKAVPEVVCNNAVATIALTPPAAPNNYPSYTWTPIANLFTNATATTPYAGGSATTVYMKTTNVGQQTYYMMAGNPALTTGCTFADTVKIHVQPGNITIKGQPDTICLSGTTTLSLDTIAGYFPGTIQWQRSTDGTTYTDITGATNVTYTTPPLTFGNNTYYKALVRAGSAICESPVKYVVIANPSIVSAPDSFNCGPGSVTLSAITGGNGSAVWYENATGGLPIASGSPFVTPYLAATTSYYVSSGGGGSSGNQTIGAGANTSSDYVSPFYHVYGGQKNQYLIRADELIAAGIPPGANITSIAFDVVTSGFTYNSFSMSVGTTAATALTTTWQTPLTEVRSPANYTTTSGINTIIFNSPFPWNGTSNLVVQTCYSNNNGGGTSNSVRIDNTAYVSSAYQRVDNVTPAVICSNTATYGTYSKRPKFVVAYDNRCESPRQEVVAYIHPKPEVDLGQDINKCVDLGAVEVLNAGVQPNTPSYLWDNGSTMQVRAVTESGTYSVIVENQFTCKGYDTINVSLRKNPVVNLGNDTSVCNGVTLTLNAGNDGVDYFWNTGAVSQTINVNTAGSYNVFVTNGVACTKADTINIAMQGELPTIQGIAVNNNGLYTFQFNALNPQNVIGYDWDFGDSSLHSYQQSPTHTYPDAGNYIVVLRLSSSCGFNDDSTSAHIVGLNQLNVDNGELSVYPNPTKGEATILSKGALKMEKVEIYNILGQQVYAADADSKERHRLDLGRLASGVYTIQVFTDKGNVARKLEILK